jgi:hypothetical protein
MGIKVCKNSVINEIDLPKILKTFLLVFLYAT